MKRVVFLVLIILVIIFTMMGCGGGNSNGNTINIPRIPESLKLGNATNSGSVIKARFIDSPVPTDSHFSSCAKVVGDYNGYIDLLVKNIVPYLKSCYTKGSFNSSFSMVGDRNHPGTLKFESLTSNSQYNVKATVTFSSDYVSLYGMTAETPLLILYFNTNTPNWDYTFNNWDSPGDESSPHWILKIVYDEVGDIIRTRAWTMSNFQLTYEGWLDEVGIELLVQNDQEWLQFFNLTNSERIHVIGVANLTEGKPTACNLEYSNEFISPYDGPITNPLPALLADSCNTALLKKNTQGVGEVIAWQVVDADIQGDLAIFPKPSMISANPLPWNITYDEVQHLKFDWKTLEKI